MGFEVFISTFSPSNIYICLFSISINAISPFSLYASEYSPSILFFQKKKKENVLLDIRKASLFAFLPVRAQFSSSSDKYSSPILFGATKLIDAMVLFHYFYSHVYGSSTQTLSLLLMHESLFYLKYNNPNDLTTQPHNLLQMDGYEVVCLHAIEKSLHTPNTYHHSFYE